MYFEGAKRLKGAILGLEAVVVMTANMRPAVCGSEILPDFIGDRQTLLNVHLSRGGQHNGRSYELKTTFYFNIYIKYATVFTFLTLTVTIIFPNSLSTLDRIIVSRVVRAVSNIFLYLQHRAPLIIRCQ